MRLLFAIAFVFLLSSSQFVGAQTESKIPYNRSKILLARFGDKEKQELFEKVRHLRTAINSQIIGQDAIASALQMRLIQYLNSLGTRTGEPIALHMIGLPGVGKTSITKIVEQMGFPIVKLDAQKYAGGENSTGEYHLMQALEGFLELRTRPDQPLILFVDELDKIPEKDDDGKHVTQPVISFLNEVLSEGKLTNRSRAGSKLDFSNVFIMTAMNFAPSQIEKFSEAILEEKKSYWDFNESDMRRFDEWMRDPSRSSVAKILSLLFRDNVVSRMVPDALVARALQVEDMNHIVEINLKAAISRLTQHSRGGLRVEFTDEFLRFLRRSAVYLPSGARTTVKRVDLLTEQLVSIASRTDMNRPQTLSLPREVELDFDSQANQAVVRVKSFSKPTRDERVIAEAELNVPYNAQSSSFEYPSDELKPLPKELSDKAEKTSKQEKKEKVTSSSIRHFRHSMRNDFRIKEEVSKEIFDQDELITDLDANLHFYMNSDVEEARFQTIPGFTGVGKTAMVMAAAHALDIPVVKMNMQEYSGESQEAADAFGRDLFERIEEAVEESPTGKYILLLEELDKAFEVDPTNGALVRRPVLAYIKDLLSDGFRSVNISTSFNNEQKIVDIRHGYTILTMNFGLDRFDIHADPRLTTIEDMRRLADEIASTPDNMRELFSSLFLPETINRLISNSMKMAKPLTRRGYMEILKLQIEEVVKSLTFGDDPSLNHGAISLKLSRRYFMDYLFAESVIPSEGGRQAAKTAKSMLLRDVLEAIQNLPTKSVLFTRPIEIHLDFQPKTQNTAPKVVAKARLSDAKDIAKARSDLSQQLYSSDRKLRFPPLQEFGPMSMQRMLIAGHEFGHAFASVLLGYRFEYSTAVSPSSGVGGYVKPKSMDYETGRYMLADALITVGARAMERVLLSSNPESPNSVLEITSGPFSDIQMATEVLWNMIYQLGMDPQGGVIERSGLAGQRNDYNARNFLFAELSDQKVNQLGLVIRDLEDYLVHQLLESHTREWYIDKITTFSKKGGMSEKQFYDLIGYKYPGDNKVFIGEQLTTERHFGASLKQESAEVLESRRFRQPNGKTAAENMQDAIETFKNSLSKHLHSKGEDCDGKLAS